MNLPQEVVDSEPWEAGALTLKQVSGLRCQVSGKTSIPGFFLRPKT